MYQEFNAALIEALPKLRSNSKAHLIETPANLNRNWLEMTTRLEESRSFTSFHFYQDDIKFFICREVEIISNYYVKILQNEGDHDFVIDVKFFWLSPIEENPEALLGDKIFTLAKHVALDLWPEPSCLYLSLSLKVQDR